MTPFVSSKSIVWSVFSSLKLHGLFGLYMLGPAQGQQTPGPLILPSTNSRDFHLTLGLPSCEARLDARSSSSFFRFLFPFFRTQTSGSFPSHLQFCFSFFRRMRRWRRGIRNVASRDYNLTITRRVLSKRFSGLHEICALLLTWARFRNTWDFTPIASPLGQLSSTHCTFNVLPRCGQTMLKRHRSLDGTHVEARP